MASADGRRRLAPSGERGLRPLYGRVDIGRRPDRTATKTFTGRGIRELGVFVRCRFEKTSANVVLHPLHEHLRRHRAPAFELGQADWFRPVSMDARSFKP